MRTIENPYMEYYGEVVKFMADPDSAYDPLKIELPPIMYLAFKGGGGKGPAYLGSIEELEKAGILKDIESVGGSSIGGITALLVGLGYSVKELKAITSKMNLGDFMDEDDFGWWNPINLSKTIKMAYKIYHAKGHGIYKGDAFMKWAGVHIANILDDENATFADLQLARAKNPRLKDMKFTGTNIDHREGEIYDYRHTPNMRILDAVRITMSLPFAFKAHPMMGEDGRVQLKAYGGIAANHAAGIYDNSHYLPDGVEFTDMGVCPCTLSLLVNEPWESERIKGKYTNNQERVALPGYIRSVLEGMMSQTGLWEKHKENTIDISVDVSTLAAKLTDSQREELYEAGRTAGKEWIDKRKQKEADKSRNFKSAKEKYEKLEDNEKLRTAQKVGAAYLMLLNEVASHDDQTPTEAENKRLILLEDELMASRLYVPLVGPAEINYKRRNAGKAILFPKVSLVTAHSEVDEMLSSDVLKALGDPIDQLNIAYNSTRAMRMLQKLKLIDERIKPICEGAMEACHENLKKVDALITTHKEAMAVVKDTKKASQIFLSAHNWMLQAIERINIKSMDLQDLSEEDKEMNRNKIQELLTDELTLLKEDLRKLFVRLDMTEDDISQNLSTLEDHSKFIKKGLKRNWFSQLSNKLNETKVTIQNEMVQTVTRSKFSAEQLDKMDKNHDYFKSQRRIFEKDLNFYAAKKDNIEKIIELQKLNQKLADFLERNYDINQKTFKNMLKFLPAGFVSKKDQLARKVVKLQKKINVVLEKLTDKKASYKTFIFATEDANKIIEEAANPDSEFWKEINPKKVEPKKFEITVISSTTLDSLS